MSNLYLDTNIFLYLSDKKSIYHKPCFSLINYCQDNNIDILTSTETIQEIVHYSKNTKQLTKGIIVGKNTIKLVDHLFPVTKNTIENYLDAAVDYPKAKSRDLIHLSVCVENKIKKVVSYDKDFKLFKEIKTLKPEDLVK